MEHTRPSNPQDPETYLLAAAAEADENAQRLTNEVRQMNVEVDMKIAAVKFENERARSFLEAAAMVASHSTSNQQKAKEHNA